MSETGSGPITDFNEFKTFLGQSALGYTDGQLRQLQRDMHVAADLLLDLFLAKGYRSDVSHEAAHFDRFGPED